MGKHKMVQQRRTANRSAGGVRLLPAGPQSPHPQPGTSELFFFVLSAFTMISSYDNFQLAQAHPNFLLALFDSYKLGDQDPITGAIAVFICVPYMVVKSYESMGLPPVLTMFRSWIKIPGFIACPADIRIYRDTAIVVILSYVLLLDISLSYLWLAVFPVVAIVFIYALRSKLCPRAGGHRGGEQQQPDSAAGRSGSTGDGSDAKAKTTKGSDDQEALKAIAAAPFCALLVMAQLPDSAAAMFAVSQFLLFLSTTLGALTYMMTRLPAGSGGGVAPASRLLHRASLLALLATAHALAAESLGEHVVLFVLPELAPVLLWFSLHLDRDSSIITVDDIKPRTSTVLIVLGAAGAPLFAYLATSMDELGLSICTDILVYCGVSGLLTSYLVFMLRQWPGCKDGAAASDATEPAATTTTSPHYKKQGGRGKQTTGSLDEASAKQAGSAEEAVRLLMFWANNLLISAAALLLLQHLVAVRIGLREPLVDQLAKILNHCADKYLPP